MKALDDLFKENQKYLKSLNKINKECELWKNTHCLSVELELIKRIQEIVNKVIKENN